MFENLVLSIQDKQQINNDDKLSIQQYPRHLSSLSNNSAVHLKSDLESAPITNSGVGQFSPPHHEYQHPLCPQHHPHVRAICTTLTKAQGFMSCQTALVLPQGSKCCTTAPCFSTTDPWSSSLPFSCLSISLLTAHLPHHKRCFSRAMLFPDMFLQIVTAVKLDFTQMASEQLSCVDAHVTFVIVLID